MHATRSTPAHLLRCGYDDGPTYVLTYRTSRTPTFEQWAHQDFENELAPPGLLPNVQPPDALRLMESLRAGTLDLVKQQTWQPERET